MTNLRTISLDFILNFIIGAERGAERVENRVERSGAVSGSCRKTMGRSGARSGKAAESGGYRNRLERGAAILPLTVRSHARHLGAAYRSNTPDFLTYLLHDDKAPRNENTRWPERLKWSCKTVLDITSEIGDRQIGMSKFSLRTRPA